MGWGGGFWSHRQDWWLPNGRRNDSIAEKFREEQMRTIVRRLRQDGNPEMGQGRQCREHPDGISRIVT
jgi:hypothetical protein